MTQELAKFSETLSSAPAILQTSKDRVDKAKEFGLQLLAKIEQGGMSNDLDKQANDYLVKVKKTGELIHKNRTPITQLLDAVKKNFTQLEAEISPKTPGGIYAQVQSYRDTYAKKLLSEQREREEAARRKQAIADEKVKIRAEAETKFSEYFIEYLASHKEEMNKAFNGITLETIESVKKKLLDWPAEYPPPHPSHFTFNPHVIYITTEDVNSIKDEVIRDKVTLFKADFKATITEHKKMLWDFIPSKKTELEAIAEAEKNNAEEANRLKAEKEKREKLERERLAKEADDKRQASVQKAEAKKDEAKMENLFDATANAVDPDTARQERTGYTIIISHPAGYVPVFSMWFEAEGKNLPMESIENKSIKQMKTFCEKVAHKEETMIQSPYIRYEEIVKTRAKA